MQKPSLSNTYSKSRSQIKVMRFTLELRGCFIYHTREPLYSKSAVIAWWSQSTSGKNVDLAVEKGNKFLNISLLRVSFAAYCQ